jgi:hypothetical protein
MSFESVPMPTKRQGLVDVLTDVISNHGETFTVKQKPVSLMLNMGDRMSRMDILENSNGEIRYLEVYYDGFRDPNSDAEPAGQSTLRNDHTQHGSVDAFRVVMMYGIEQDPTTGEVTSFVPWETLLTSYNPMGIFPTLREKRYIQPVVQGNDDMVYLSLPHDLAYPNIPRSLMGSGDERAHYVDFTVTITDA